MKAPSASIVLFLAASSLSAAQDEKHLRDVFKAKYEAYEKAFIGHDPSFLPKMLAPNYSAEQKGQPTMNRETTIKMFAGLSAATQGASWKRDIQSVKLSGGKAAVAFIGHFKGKMAGPDHKNHEIAFEATNVDTWVRVGGDWKLEHSKVLSFAMTRDGKPTRG